VSIFKHGCYLCFKPAQVKKDHLLHVVTTSISHKTS